MVNDVANKKQFDIIFALSWMCWDCSLVNEEQRIYVEKSEDVHGLFWLCQTCIVNKVDVLT